MHAQTENPNTTEHARLLHTVEQGIEQIPDFDIHLLAQRMYMSRYTLHRHTVALFGISPGRLILKTRLEKARNLLARKKQAVAEIAFETGFNSITRFSSEFKKHFGVCPRNWRQQTS
jgi:AraC-like DNA-binding protein